MELKGLSKSEAAEFREWMDARENNVETIYDKQNDILRSLAKRSKEKKDEPFTALVKKQANTVPQSKKILNFLDSTLGRASHSMQELVLGKDFVDKQDEAYKGIAEKKKAKDEKEDRLERLHTITKAAENKKEKAADIAGKGLGLANYIVPGVGAESAVSKLAGLAKLAKPGSQLAEMLAVKGTEKGFEKLSKIALNRSIKGAASGAVFGVGNEAVRAGFGEELSPEERLKRIGLDTAFGAVADPLLMGAGSLVAKGVGKMAKGEVPTFTGRPSESVVDSLAPSKQHPLEALRKLKTLGQNEPELKGDFGSFVNKMKATQEGAATAEKIKPQGDFSRLKAGRDFEPIEPKGVNEYELVKAPINRDIPYTPGDPLPDTTGHIVSKVDKTKPSFKNLRELAYNKGIDNVKTLDHFDERAEAVLGRSLKPSERSYMLALNSRGSDQVVKQILTSQLVNKEGEAIGPSLKEVVSKIPKRNLKQFEDYLVNRHAITRMERGEKVFPDEMKMNAAKSAAKVQTYEAQYPDFKDIAEQYYNFDRQFKDKWLVDMGMFTKETMDEYRAANPYYISNNRYFSSLEKNPFRGKAKNSFANQNVTIHKATGSQRPIISPIESTIETTDKIVKAAKRNEVMQSVIKVLQEDPEGMKGWAEILPTKDMPTDMKNALKENGVEGVIERFNETFDKKPDLTNGNVVYGMIDGKKVHVKVHDPALLDALVNLSPKAQNTVVKAVGQVTRMMKTLTTGVNPVFSLTRNIWRDIPTAYVNSKSTNNPFVFTKDLIGSVISVLRNDDLYKSFKSVGGGHASPVSSDINLLAQSKRSLLPQKGIRPLLGKGVGAIENLNNAVEAAPRLGEFKRFVKQDPSYNGKIKGLYEANDVTVNFNRHGNFAKEVDAFVPYLNAALQGLDKTVRVVKDNPIKSTVKAFTAVTIPSIALYAINHKDPDYNELSSHIKDNNFLIPNGDGTFTKIPKPRELGPIFGADVERALRMWNDQDPQAFDNFAETFIANFFPPTRTIAAPIGDIRANKNFMDAPIVPADLEALSPEYQYDSKTSEIAKELGKLTNKSPKQIDYLFKSYGGVLAELGIPATTKGATIRDTLKQKVTADPVFSNDRAKEFYDLKEKLDRAYADLNKLGVESSDYDDEMRKELNARQKEMSDYRKEIKAVQNDDSIDRNEKQRQIRKLQQFINELSDISRR
ncbi:LPD38 domain-containing protein [Bacillus testis]|uniref:LPD38 domain-containing protein n=1 Tax=Bacillus testis TaxID=1622072 RepID=UPI0011CB6414|nr:LPD38 domain-containing protein [Bacillus testis]